MSDIIENVDNEQHPQFSLGVAEAQQLATVTKSAPQMQGITSRWLLKILPWVQVRGGVYQVNRVLNYKVGGGKVVIANTGSAFRVIPRTLSELSVFHGFHDREILTAISNRFVQREYACETEIVTHGSRADQLFLIAYGQVEKIEGENTSILEGGDHFGEEALLRPRYQWPYSVKAKSRCVVLTLSRSAFEDFLAQHPALKEYIECFKDGQVKALRPLPPQFKAGLGTSLMATEHKEETPLPSTFIDYEVWPRKYELSVAQTILRIQTRVADLYNDPMNQTEHQLKLTVEALRERQEYEMINNPDFGLLNNADFEQRISAHGDAPTPDDFDELITRRRDPQFILAHPRTIAAFGRECTRLGIYPQNLDMGGVQVPAWRGIPVLPCTKLPIDPVKKTTSVLVLRTGENNQGVIGLNQTGIPDEYEPGTNVRFMGIDDKAIISYLVSIYYSVAVLVPDALGVLEDIKV